MINVHLIGHRFEYEVKEIINLFFKDEIIFVDKIPASSRDIFIISEISEQVNEVKINSKVLLNGIITEEDDKKDIPQTNSAAKKKILKRYIKLGILKILSKATGHTMPWGILTGVRPTKVAQELIVRGLRDQEIITMLQESYGVSESKAIIMTQVARNEKEIIEKNNSNSISVYIGIPFCPDRCLYCSFTSNPINKYTKMVDSFLDALKKEIETLSRIINEKNWYIDTLYIGGGTPTSLNHRQLASFLEQVDSNFNLKLIKEITIEAGRPDTIDREKLSVMKKYGVNRLSINPQTMNNETLKIIGRNHRVEDIDSAFKMARTEGFDNINTDLIAGLPGEDIAMMANTLEKIQQLSPESITIHTLAVKRGSKLIEERSSYDLPEESVVESMIELCRSKTAEMGMLPYYLYRQKNMVGHQENIGYCLPDKECIYNIKMIEEVQNIIALGPGAVTRVIDRETGAIEKVFNDKSVEGYIARIDEMIERKVEACRKKDA